MLSIVNIWAPFYPVSHGESARVLHSLAVHHTIRRLLSLVIFLVSWKLYKRVSAAWAVVMPALSLGIFQYLLLYHNRLGNPLFLLELVSHFVLLLSRNYYCRKPDRYSLRRGLAVFLVYAGFVLVNAVLALHRAKGHLTLWAGGTAKTAAPIWLWKKTSSICSAARRRASPPTGWSGTPWWSWATPSAQPGSFCPFCRRSGPTANRAHTACCF